MPAIVGVQDVVAPAHRLRVGNGVAEAAKVHSDVVKGVLGALAPAHQRCLVVTPVAELDRPAVAISLIRRVAVHMLPLLHEDASDLVTLELSVPRAAPDVGSSGGERAQVLTLVEANTIGVCFDETKGITAGAHGHPLDGSVLQLLRIGALTRGLGPDVHVELLS